MDIFVAMSIFLTGIICFYALLSFVERPRKQLVTKKDGFLDIIWIHLKKK